MTRNPPGTGTLTATTASQRDESPGTLGDLLFADPSRRRISEQEWVDIIQAIAARDEAALRALYERSHRIAFTLIMRITRNRQTAEELTIDVFHDVWRRAPQYDAENGSVLGWIMNQARSRAIDRLRYEQRQKRVDPFSQDSSPQPEAADYEEAVDRQELARRLREAVTILTHDERQAIEAAYFSEMTHAEVAAHLQQPLGTIKTRIRSGLGKLRAHFGPDREDP
jgi:RNA polymerase sigma-70 factor, ECF subfamily